MVETSCGCATRPVPVPTGSHRWRDDQGHAHDNMGRTERQRAARQRDGLDIARRPVRREACSQGHRPHLPPMLPFGLLGLLHLYIGWRIAPQLPAPAAAALLVTLVASALLIPWAMTRRRTPDRAAADRWTRSARPAKRVFLVVVATTKGGDMSNLSWSGAEPYVM
jgi:hypothetical protein